MAFKQQGFNPGEGTGMGSAFTKKKGRASGAIYQASKAGKDAEELKKKVKAHTTMQSPLTIAEEGDIDYGVQGGKYPVNLKTKDTRKKNTKTKTKAEHKKSKIDVKTAKKLYGKDSPEYAAAVSASEATKEAKKKSQTGREKIRTKMKEKKDERTRKKNINQTKRDKIKQTKAEAKWLKDNPDMTNIPMP